MQPRVQFRCTKIPVTADLISRKPSRPCVALQSLDVDVTRNLAASGLPINGSKACLDFCEGLSGEVGAELSPTSLSSSPVAPCCGAALEVVLRTAWELSICGEVNRASGLPTSTHVGLDRTSTPRREACCLEDAVFSRTPNWVGRGFMVTMRSYSGRLLQVSLGYCCSCVGLATL